MWWVSLTQGVKDTVGLHITSLYRIFWALFIFCHSSQVKYTARSTNRIIICNRTLLLSISTLSQNKHSQSCISCIWEWRKKERMRFHFRLELLDSHTEVFNRESNLMYKSHKKCPSWRDTGVLDHKGPHMSRGIILQTERDTILTLGWVVFRRRI